MSKPGPKPTPSKILKLRGSWRANGREGEPDAPVQERYMAPEWMPDEAKVHWKRVVGDLKPLGLLSRIDTNTLARYCVLFERWLVAMRFVHQFGDTLTIRDAQQKIVSIRTMPQSRILRELSVGLLRMEREFGMTPSARASFGIEREKAGKGALEKQGKDRFFAS